MRVELNGERMTLCDGCGTRLDGRENANKSLAAYGSSESGRFVAKTNICRTNGTACMWAHAGGHDRHELVRRYLAERAALAASPDGQERAE